MTTVGRYTLATVPALLVMGFFVWFANWIPQTRWEPPRRQAITAEMTPVELATLGENIVRQRGCMACHTIEPGAGVKGGGRGPNWADLAQRRARGVPGGKASLVDYLVEALYDPGAYLVEGYANIMPAATRPPANLTYEEIVAVVNLLQSLGGTPSVKVGDIPRPTGAVAQPTRAGAPVDAAALFTTVGGCGGCHSLESGKVLVGPALDAASLRKTAAERSMSPEDFVRESILKPVAFEKEGFPKGLMPQDFATRLRAEEVDALVRYLLSREGGS